MTKTGNTHARRVLVEGAWAYRSPATVSRPWPRRLAHQPKIVQEIRGKAHVRLGKRSQRLLAKGKHAHGVTVAVARALVGFVGARAKEVPITLESPIDRLRNSVLVRTPLRRGPNGREQRRSPGSVSPSVA